MNVAYGGSLHQHIQEWTHFNDHRENKADPMDIQYGHSHHIKLTDHGLLHTLYGQPEVRVNSLHGQGINQLAPGLRVEAIAEESMITTTGYLLHPEYQVTQDAFYQSIFTAFARACNGHQQSQGGR